MTTTTMTRPAGGNDRMRTADYILAMPRRKPKDEARERELARRAVDRLGGQDTAEILDMLGITTTEQPPQPETDKWCARCEQWKPKARFGKCSRYRDGLQYTCKECQKDQRHATYVQHGGYRSSHDGNIDWDVPRAGRGVPCSADAVEARIKAWTELRVNGRMEAREAAKRMRFSVRSARRYDRILKDRGLLPQTDGAGRVVG